MQMFESYFAIIPDPVLYDTDLIDGCVRLYGIIQKHCGKEGFCWATNAYLAELSGRSQSCVSKWVSILVTKGYLELVLIKDDKKVITERRLFINNRPAKKEKTEKVGFGLSGDKKINKDSLSDVIDEFTKSIMLKDVLNKFLLHYKEITKIYPSSIQFRSMLETLMKLSNKSTDIAIGLVELSIRKGWRNFYLETNNSNIDNMSNQNKQDNSNRSVTSEEY